VPGRPHGSLCVRSQGWRSSYFCASPANLHETLMESALCLSQLSRYFGNSNVNLASDILGLTCLGF
jgi:hypothetical protein